MDGFMSYLKKAGTSVLFSGGYNLSVYFIYFIYPLQPFVVFSTLSMIYLCKFDMMQTYSI